jgi:hypothetical protein
MPCSMVKFTLYFYHILKHLYDMLQLAHTIAKLCILWWSTQILLRHSFLSKCHTIPSTCTYIISFIPMRRVRPSQSQLSWNSHFLSTIKCRFMTPNFTQNDQEIKKLWLKIHLYPWVKYDPLSWMSQKYTYLTTFCKEPLHLMTWKTQKCFSHWY